jgi:uncharacterized protein YndB with AHSA1/START domain
MPDMMHLVKIHASPERVYQALTTTEGIRNWWTRDADLDSKIGGTGEFRFCYEGQRVTNFVILVHYRIAVQIQMHYLLVGAYGDEGSKKGEKQ